MMASQLHCSVCIPTRQLFAGKVYYASVPGSDGSYGVLPGHEMLVATNRNGGVLTLNLDEAGTQKRQFLLYEGAAKVFYNVLTVLGRFGVDVEKIDVEKVRSKAAAMREHIAELEKAEGDQHHAELETSKVRLDWYETQLEYKGASA